MFAIWTNRSRESQKLFRSNFPSSALTDEFIFLGILGKLHRLLHCNVSFGRVALPFWHGHSNGSEIHTRRVWFCRKTHILLDKLCQIRWPKRKRNIAGNRYRSKKAILGKKNKVNSLKRFKVLALCSRGSFFPSYLENVYENRNYKRQIQVEISVRLKR